MDIHHGVFTLHPVNFPTAVEGHLRLLDADNRISPYGLVFEARAWSDWKQWLLATVEPTMVGVAELAMHDGRDQRFGPIALKIPDTVVHRDMRPDEMRP